PRSHQPPRYCTGVERSAGAGAAQGFLDARSCPRRGSMGCRGTRWLPARAGVTQPRLQRYNGKKDLKQAPVTTGYGAAIRDGFEYLLENHPSVFTIGQGRWSPWYVGNSMTDLDSQFGK